MKLFIICAAAMTLAACSSTPDSYRIETDLSGRKVLVGKLTRAALEGDTTFTWFQAGYRRYQPDSASMAALKPKAKDLRFVLFLGTWCSDSKAEVPKMFKVFDQLAIGPGQIELYGLDHLKKADSDVPERYGVTKVPTLIVYDGSNEAGRIVEQPRESVEEDLRLMLGHRP